MDRLVDFDWMEQTHLYGMSFSEDFKDSMERYLVHGLGPGGFATAMLAHDLERALYNADVHNRKVYWAIARWVRECVPDGAHGSYDLVDDWCADKDGRRSKYVTELEKKHIVKVLST